jgi:hypothetical protein
LLGELFCSQIIPASGCGWKHTLVCCPCHVAAACEAGAPMWGALTCITYIVLPHPDSKSLRSKSTRLQVDSGPTVNEVFTWSTAKLSWPGVTTRARSCPVLKLIVDARISQCGLRVRGVHIHTLVGGLNERVYGMADIDGVHLHGAGVPAREQSSRALPRGESARVRPTCRRCCSAVQWPM